MWTVTVLRCLLFFHTAVGEFLATDLKLSSFTTHSAVEEFLATGLAASGLSVRPLAPWQSSPSATIEGLSACILVCSHKLRDKRCGVAGPLLIEELQNVCQKRGLSASMPVLACRSVGQFHGKRAAALSGY